MNELEALVELHREQYREELQIPRMVSRQPPTSLDVNTGLMHEEEASRLGMNMSGALLRRLGHPEGYGAAYPWAKALWLLRSKHCRPDHPHHRSAERPYWRGSLCQQAVKLVVIGGESHHGPMSIEQASAVLRVDRMEPLLRNAFRYIDEQMDLARWRAERRQRESEGYGPGAVPRAPIPHRPLEGAHREECPQCAA